MAKVSLIIGSKSDGKIGNEACKVLKNFGVTYDRNIFSAHREPKALDDYLRSCDADVFIAVAGLSAALPGYIAARVRKPVIGVPRNVKLGGLDALLSIMQMPSGVPVACVGIDNAKNAALLAIEILALHDSNLRTKLTKFKKKF